MPDPVYSAGSAGLFVAFLLKVDSGVYKVRNPGDTADATDIDDAFLRLDGTTDQTSLTPDSNGVMKGVLSNYNVASTVISFLNKFAKDNSATASSTVAPSFVNERGTKQGLGLTGTSGRPRILWMSYGPEGTGDDETMRLMAWGVAEVDMSSGALVYKDGQLVKPDITINGQKAEYALDIPIALFDPAWINTNATTGAGGATGKVPLPRYSPYEREYLLKAA